MADMGRPPQASTMGLLDAVVARFIRLFPGDAKRVCAYFGFHSRAVFCASAI